MKIVRRILLSLVVLLTVVVAAAFCYRAWMQHRIANEIRITSPTGIDESKFVTINGADEWITIRGQNKENPVILFLHGGPAEANSPFVPFYLPLEKDFVFVQWDQPGAGKTFLKAGDHQPALTLEGAANDGVAVVGYISRELKQPKIILIGQDWGGIVGIRMIEKRPDLFSAFVGTGQIVSMFAEQQVQYDYALSHATASHDEKMLAALKQIGPPPYRTLELYGQFQDCCRNPFWAAADVEGINRMRGLLVTTPSLALSEVSGYVKALRTDEVKLDQVAMALDDLRNTDTKFSVPVFFIQGAEDNITPTSIVIDYVAKIQAPAKGVDSVPDAGHFVMWTHPSEFLNLLHKDLAAASSAPATSP